MSRTKQFKKIYVEIVNYCNYECSFCPRTTRKKAHISVDDFKRIATQAKEFTDVLCLHLMGEPTLHPDFDVVLRLCDELDIYVHLVTNGSKIKQVGQAILDCKAIKKVCFSLNSYNIVQKKEIKNILDFSILAGSADKIVELRFFDENDVFIYAKEHLKDQAVPNVFFRFINRFKWPEQTQNSKEERTSFCLGGKIHVGILVDGTVVPCCLDNNGKIPLGNILKTNLKDIINSENFLSFIKSHEKRKPNEQFCRACRFEK